METESYRLNCVACDWQADMDTHQIHCPNCGPQALLRADYPADWPELAARPESSLLDFAAWLPAREPPSHWGEVHLACYRSERLAHSLSLSNLWIMFSGYWPERGANLESLSFKQLDAETSSLRIQERDGRIQIASSAGNLGLAIAQKSILREDPAVVLIPQASLAEMKVVESAKRDSLCLVAVEDAVYGDVIALTNQIAAELDDRVCKGGAVYNIATRGGHSVTILNALKTIGRAPDHYFQAVGSGTGAIAAWESVLRYNGTESNGGSMKLHLVQNHPFTPMVSAFRGELPEASYSAKEARQRLARVRARVLSNNTPPYSIAGGIAAALEDTGGSMYSVTNEEVDQAMALFEELEGCDLHPAAGAALAGLIQATRQKEIDPEDLIALHLTGGGSSKLREDHNLHRLKPTLVVSRHDFKKALDFIKSFVSDSAGS